MQKKNFAISVSGSMKLYKVDNYYENVMGSMKQVQIRSELVLSL